MDDRINQLKSIYAELEAEINKLITDFWNKKQAQISQAVQSIEPPATPGTAPQLGNKSLPWFKNGIRSFLRKLWHGDSRDNPDWDAVPSWKWNTVEHLSLSEYGLIREDLENIFYEMTDDPEVHGVINRIMLSIRKAMAKVSKINKQEPVTPTPVQPNEPNQPEPTPAQTNTNTQNAPIPNTNTMNTPPETTPETPQQSNAPDTNIPRGGNVTKRPRKAPTPELTPQRAKETGENLISIIQKIDSLPDEELRTTSQREEYIQLQQAATKALNDAGIVTTREGKITSAAKSKKTILNLIKIMKEMQQLQGGKHLDWEKPEHYSIFPFAGNRISPEVKQLISSVIHELKQQESSVNTTTEPANASVDVAHTLQGYEKTPLFERKNFLKSLLSEDDENFKKIILSRHLPITEKINFLKN